MKVERSEGIQLDNRLATLVTEAATVSALPCNAHGT